jgi:hypothetical protein
MNNQRLLRSRHMKVALLFYCLSFCAVTHAEPGVNDAEGLFRLTELQMDRVTAGAVFVTAEAYASTEGTGGSTFTNTQTRARTRQFIEVAFGTARARACCGEQAQANVYLNGGGDGKIVRTVSRSIVVDTPLYTYAFGFVYAFSINPPVPKLKHAILRSPAPRGGPR